MAFGRAERNRGTLCEECQVNPGEFDARHIQWPADELVRLTHNLEDTRLAAEGTDDKLLVYLIEVVLFHAREKLASKETIIEAGVPSKLPKETLELKSKPNLFSVRTVPPRHAIDVCAARASNQEIGK